MRNLILLSLIIPALSACGIVGAAVDIITLPVDLLTEADIENNPENADGNTAMAFTE